MPLTLDARHRQPMHGIDAHARRQAGDFRLHQFSGDPSLWREGGEAHDAGGEIAEVTAPRCLRREGEVEVGGARYSACVIIYAPYQ